MNEIHGTDGTTEKERRAKEAFLLALADCASVVAACKVTKLPRRTAYNWRSEDADFKAAWDAALDLGTDALEDEAIRRAFRGTRKPVYQGKELVGHIREYSDTLLIFMLKARRPHKFKDRSAMEVTGKDGKPIEINGSLTVEQFRQLPANERIRILTGPVCPPSAN